MTNPIKDKDLKWLAELVGEWHQHKPDIREIIGKRATLGNIGDFIGARIFDIALFDDADSNPIDGYFKSGPRIGKSVNIRMYSRNDYRLDVDPTTSPDHYLVFTGPETEEPLPRGSMLPWGVEGVFLFNARPLIAKLRREGKKLDDATSVREEDWDRARIYPRRGGAPLRLTDEQRAAIRWFVLR